MATSTNDLTKLLRLIADISDSDQPELISAVYSSARATRNGFAKAIKSEAAAIPHKSIVVKDEDIVLLEQYDNRDELGRFLKSVYPRKAEIETVARFMKLSISKTSKYEEIVEKIIDASIGYKLRSRAIRGE